MNVTLSARECDGDRLPDCCASCGGEADTRVDRKFLWNPSWVFIFVLFGLLPVLIAILLTRKSMNVRVPLCRHHAGQWSRRNLFATVSLLGFIALFVVGIVLMGDAPRGQENPVAVACLVIGMLGFLVSVIIVVIWNNRLIRPAYITRDSITLAGVHEDFVDAVENAGSSRRGRYDDYEDDRPQKRRRYDDGDDRDNDYEDDRDEDRRRRE